jgi:hypothetical protein
MWSRHAGDSGNLMIGNGNSATDAEDNTLLPEMFHRGQAFAHSVS